MKTVMDTIQQSLTTALNQPRPAARQHGVTIDVVARTIFTPDERTDEAPTTPTAPADQVSPGQFVSRSFTNHAGTRAYKLYIPASYSTQLGAPVPVVVMLHGCTQSPDDFAAGTRMNALADQCGFLVVYPAQAANANGSKCWNWFRSEDQDRDRGEPSLMPVSRVRSWPAITSMNVAFLSPDCHLGQPWPSFSARPTRTFMPPSAPIPAYLMAPPTTCPRLSQP
jgi:hypothetical protein